MARVPWVRFPAHTVTDSVRGRTNKATQRPWLSACADSESTVAGNDWLPGRAGSEAVSYRIDDHSRCWDDIPPGQITRALFERVRVQLCECLPLPHRRTSRLGVVTGTLFGGDGRARAHGCWIRPEVPSRKRKADSNRLGRHGCGSLRPSSSARLRRQLTAPNYTA